MEKPIAYGITSWHPYKTIFYKCPKCGTDFRIFGENEKFCHNCGIEIDWNVLLELNKAFDCDDYEGKKIFITELNLKQRNK